MKKTMLFGMLFISMVLGQCTPPEESTIEYLKDFNKGVIASHQRGGCSYYKIKGSEKEQYFATYDITRKPQGNPIYDCSTVYLRAGAFPNATSYTYKFPLTNTGGVTRVNLKAIRCDWYIMVYHYQKSPASPTEACWTSLRRTQLPTNDGLNPDLCANGSPVIKLSILMLSLACIILIYKNL